jgi:hypothetical protein
MPSVITVMRCFSAGRSAIASRLSMEGRASLRHVQIADAPEGSNAIKDIALLKDVREHTLPVLKRPCEKFNEARLGKNHLMFRKEVQPDPARDNELMSGMSFGEALDFSWILAEIKKAEALINS